jgi:hypothetical protein
VLARSLNDLTISRGIDIVFRTADRRGRYMEHRELPHLVCGTCGSDLGKSGSVEYFERYDAYLSLHSATLEVRPTSSTVDSSARCARCGCGVEFADVEFDT